MTNIDEFLRCKTPESWVQAAIDDLPTLLIDHANCEKKAASTALNLMYRYVEKPAMLLKLSKLAREELRHFEQVLGIMRKREIEYQQIASARYAGELRKGVRTHEPARLIDILIVSAIVEARSCERFEALIPHLDRELSEFYTSLLKSEARHFMVYLDFARQYSTEDISDRIAFFLAEDERLILSADEDFRFHSGVPALAA
ncbi:MAG: tRNA-(ms[2]io[6]A)-hydroxylase [Pseudomonadales bacterium]|nr:tRNA-(ms[2]io[6]A)-hydroxylase [Pseudomonadales bacterium]